MTRPRTTIICEDGPHNGRIYTYGQPLPDVIVIADDRLQYHEYLRTPHNVYKWQRSYRIAETEPAEQASGEILAW